MASHAPTTTNIDEKVQLHEAGGIVKLPALLLGVGGLAACLIVCLTIYKDSPGFGRFYHAYLISFVFVLTIALGGLIFTMITHLFRSGWVVVVRRIPETFAATLPYLGLLALPILYSVWTHNGELYPWAVKPKDGAKLEHHASIETSPVSRDRQGAPSLDTAGTLDRGATLAGARGSTGTPAHDGVVRLAADPQGQLAADAGQADSGHSAEKSGDHGGYGDKGAHGISPPGYHTAYGYAKYDDFTAAKQPYLSDWFFTLRIIGYFVTWTILARFFYGSSRRQDSTGDPALTARMSSYAAPAIILFALSLTFAAFDLMMSLDHHWYSTMFGVYIFAGAMIACFSSTIVVLNALQRSGYLTKSVGTEHFHDLGKLLFAFVFFFGYIAFSQYMLLWYANMPETTHWWLRRGAATLIGLPDFDPLGESFNAGTYSQFSTISVILIVGHFLLPFAFLLSRHIKRNRDLLLIAAVWMLVMHWINIYWLIMPELNNGVFYFGLPEVLGTLGTVGIFVFLVTQIASKAPLRPIKDPRLAESLRFQNI